MSEKTLPPPGSDEAIAMGCTCPVMDNGRGTGYLGQKNIFVMSASCPIHFRPMDKTSEDSDDSG